VQYIFSEKKKTFIAHNIYKWIINTNVIPQRSVFAKSVYLQLKHYVSIMSKVHTHILFIKTITFLLLTNLHVVFRCWHNYFLFHTTSSAMAKRGGKVFIRFHDYVEECTDTHLVILLAPVHHAMLLKPLPLT